MAAPSRRALVVGLAALPAFATASVMPQDDPTFAAILRYRHAAAELVTIDEVMDPTRYAAAEAEVCASSAALFAIKPTTLAGATALAGFVCHEDGQAHWAKPALVSLSAALPQLTA